MGSTNILLSFVSTGDVEATMHGYVICVCICVMCVCVGVYESSSCTSAVTRITKTGLEGETSLVLRVWGCEPSMFSWLWCIACTPAGTPLGVCFYNDCHGHSDGLSSVGVKCIGM